MTTQVRIAVARFELTPFTPSLPKIEVKAAKTADRIANIIHINTPISNPSIEKSEYFRTRPKEVPTRFELVMKVLQTFALPLGHGTKYVLETLSQYSRGAETRQASLKADTFKTSYR